MAGLTTNDVGGCCCSGCAVSLTSLAACHGIRYAGATLNAWTNSSKTTLVATGNTDSSGNVTLDVGTGGTYWFELVSNSTRWVGGEASRFVTNGSNISGFPLLLSFAAGYVSCIVGCRDPLAAHLFTSFLAPDDLLIWNGTSWTGLRIALFANGTVLVGHGAGPTETCTAVINSCPPSVLITATACDQGLADFTITE